MPGDPKTLPGLPGRVGSDYEIVNYAGRIYVVYKTKLPNGKYITDAWRVTSSDYKGLGINKQRIKHITRGQFKNLEVFGDIGEIVRQGGGKERPLQTYMKQLRETYGARVSWLGDSEYMEVFMMGYLENWDPGVLQQRLKRTKWYQSRTQAQRSWELDMNNADRKAAIGNTRTMVEDALKDLYGTQFGDQKISSKQIDGWAKDIASGKYGDPNQGFQTWLERMTDKAEKIEGSAAWIDRQSALEDQRAFMNRPEDMFEQIRNDAMEWLGPKGMPDHDTLMNWATRLVSEKSSDGDWQEYLRKQSQALYPWLGPNERWQDRASAYKNLIEDEMGTAVGYDNGLLQQIGYQDGDKTRALNFHEFTQLIRSKEEWWSGAKAAEEGYDLFNTLNSLFNGVS